MSPTLHKHPKGIAPEMLQCLLQLSLTPRFDMYEYTDWVRNNQDRLRPRAHEADESPVLTRLWLREAYLDELLLKSQPVAAVPPTTEPRPNGSGLRLAGAFARVLRGGRS